MQKFKLAYNPMVDGDNDTIVHMLNPISLIEVHEGHITTEHPHNHYTYINAEGATEPYTLSLYHCFTTTFDGEEQNIMIEKLLKKAWHWYSAYMTWEDTQHDNE